VALLLRKQGIKHIRPLQGGLDAWRGRGFPLDTVTIESASEKETALG
jgi:rhodanese-related sulfurtransferase